MPLWPQFERTTNTTLDQFPSKTGRNLPHQDFHVISMQIFTFVPRVPFELWAQMNTRDERTLLR